MAVIVILVGVFLMGLQVGRGVLMARGVPGAETTAAANEAEPPPPPASASPSSTSSPATAGEKLSYAERLGAATPPKETLKPERLLRRPKLHRPKPKHLIQLRRRSRPRLPGRIDSWVASKPAPPAKTAPVAPLQRPSRDDGARASAEPAGNGFAIQVAALREPEEADAIVKRLAGKGYSAYVVAPAKGQPPVYRVRVGKFKERREADTVRRSCRRKSSSSPGSSGNQTIDRRGTPVRCAARAVIPRYGHPRRRSSRSCRCSSRSADGAAARPRCRACRPRAVSRSGCWPDSFITPERLLDRRDGLHVRWIAGDRVGFRRWIAGPLHGRLHRGIRRHHRDPHSPLRHHGFVARAVRVGIDGVLARHPDRRLSVDPLGNTMVTFLPVAQLASVVGVYGLSIFVALLNTGFAIAAMSAGRRGSSSRRDAGADHRHLGLGGCVCRRTS
jgi:cell division septation protein DedD